MVHCRARKLLLFSILLVGILPPARSAETEECKEDELRDDNGDCCIATMMLETAAGKECQEEISGESFGLSVTLIGSFTFLISLQHFTEHPDEEMKKYSWKVISSTLAIFIGVLMFQSFDGIVDHYIVVWMFGNKWLEFVIDLCHMVVWYLIMQVVLYVNSGAAKPAAERKQLMDPEQTKKEELRRVKDKVEINCLSYGRVFSHLTGFASINAWSGLQQCPPFNSSPFTALLPAVFCFLVQEVLQRITAVGRTRHGTGWFTRKWDLICGHAEDDVLGLTLSVVVVNSIRLAINNMVPEGVGCLPDQNQEAIGHACETFDKHYRSLPQIGLLFLVGVTFAIALFFVKLFQEKFFPGGEEDVALAAKSGKAGKVGKADVTRPKIGISDRRADRKSQTVVIVLGIAFSWCMFHCNRQMLMYLDFRYLGGGRAQEFVPFFLALEITYVAFFAMGILNRLAELPDRYTPPAVDKSIVSVIHAMGIWIGFAWESCFEASVDNLAEVSRNYGGSNAPALTRFTLGLVISIFVFKSWKKFQIPYLVKNGWRFGYVTSGTQLREVLQKLEEEEPELNVMDTWAAYVSQYSFESGDFVADAKDDLKRLKKKNNAIIRAIAQSREAKLKVEAVREHVDDLRLSMTALQDSISEINRPGGQKAASSRASGGVATAGKAVLAPHPLSPEEQEQLEQQRRFWERA